MRVVAGTAGGLTLRLPRDSRVRPTADHNKQALFSMLEALLAFGSPDADVGSDAIWSRVRAADLFAGSGGLGIEALSRGAERVLFVDNDPSALAAIRANLATTGLSDRAEVLAADAHRIGDRLPGPLELILLDPPYDDAGTFELAARIARAPGLARDAILCIEHGRRRVAPDTLGTFAVQRSRRHGDTILTVYARGRYDRRGTHGASESE